MTVGEWWAALPLPNRVGICFFSAHILVQDGLILAFVYAIIKKRGNMYLQAVRHRAVTEQETARWPTFSLQHVMRHYGLCGAGQGRLMPA